MKTKLLLSILLLGAFLFGKAQPTITFVDNAFNIGDSILLYNAQDAINFDPGAAGADVTWNFSTLIDDGPTHDLKYLDATTTDTAGNFPAATISEMLNGDNSGYFYFNLDNDDWNRVGFDMFDAPNNLYLYIPYDTPLQLYDYPLTYGSTFNSTYSGTGQYDMGGTVDEAKAENGTYAVNSDGYGTLILPNITYPNALRVHITESFTLGLYMMGIPLVSSSISDDIYMWFVDSVQGPVMQYVVSTTDGTPTYRVSYFKQIVTEIIPNFTANNLTPNTDDTVSFTNNTSPMGGTTYQWEFTPASAEYLNGTDSASTDPVVRFTADGLYTVNLIATNAGYSPGVVNEEKTDYINVSLAPQLLVDFTVDDFIPAANVSITFTNLTDPISGTTFAWAFDPSDIVTYTGFTNETSIEPQVKFSIDGLVSVMLVATNDNFSNSPVTEIRMDYINVGGVGINEISNSNFEVFPNPTSGIINLNIDKHIKNISVYDILGNQIESFEVIGSSIDLKAKSNGVYIIKVSTEKGILTKRVLINK